MSRSGKAGPAPAGGWLDGDQQRAWLAYIRVQLRLSYEMNRQLLADSASRCLGGLARPLGGANHGDPVMTSHMNDRKPGSVTIDIGSGT